jgi:hypothetical protein
VNSVPKVLSYFGFADICIGEGGGSKSFYHLFLFTPPQIAHDILIVTHSKSTDMAVQETCASSCNVFYSITAKDFLFTILQ